MNEVSNEVLLNTPDGFINFIVSLFNKTEIKILLIAVILTFAITYIVKIVYNIIIKLNQIQFTNHIRIIAIVSGFISSYLIWPDNLLSMHWYEAGMLVGPGSILIYHVLSEMSETTFFKNRLPWVSKLLKGFNDE